LHIVPCRRHERVGTACWLVMRGYLKSGVILGEWPVSLWGRRRWRSRRRSPKEQVRPNSAIACLALLTRPQDWRIGSEEGLLDGTRIGLRE
jgi:hypothetical protein